ncbi:aspartate/glutamate racemase family protein [Allohahella marinimesophila]|uniref:Aspartate/glutamate racemase family protein n=2 Tax=Allohahella marinimesophila TaxID=1054972 RepID=A0ABP7NJ20_9GAMM
MSASALMQFETEKLLAAANLLADAKPAAIAWNGTSASWLGFAHDESLCAAIERETGIPTITSVLTLNELLASRDITRLGLVTPYHREVQARIIENYAGLGIEVVGDIHFGETNNFAFAEFDEAFLADRIRLAARSEPQAITILCTNLRAAPLVAELEVELGIPIYDSVAIVVWKALQLAGIDSGPLRKWGSLFQ